MCGMHDRRAVLGICVGGLVTAGAAEASGERQAYFLGEAERMRRQSVAAGDQSFGAVLVLEDAIVGYGASRVVMDRNPDAHAERVAIWRAQAALGRKDLSGAVLYSTSRPCWACETIAAEANVARMLHGTGIDAGRPQVRR